MFLPRVSNGADSEHLKHASLTACIDEQTPHIANGVDETNYLSAAVIDHLILLKVKWELSIILYYTATHSKHSH